MYSLRRAVGECCRRVEGSIGHVDSWFRYTARHNQHSKKESPRVLVHDIVSINIKSQAVDLHIPLFLLTIHLGKTIGLILGLLKIPAIGLDTSFRLASLFQLIQTKLFDQLHSRSRHNSEVAGFMSAFIMEIVESTSRPLMILLIGSAAFFPLIEVIGKQVVRARLPGCGKKILGVQVR
jgi:hypothetical protein